MMRRLFVIQLVLLALLNCMNTVWAGFPPMEVTAKSKSPAQEFWVTKDVGLDTNDCSIFRPCKTIGAGITAAVNAGCAYYKQCIIRVAPSNGGSSSSYNEDVTIAQQGITLKCNAPQAGTRACLISGTLTVNMTGTSGGANYIAGSNESYVDGFVISKNNSSQVINFTGSTFQRLILTNCYIDENGTGSAVVLDNSGAASALISYDTVFANNNATNPTISLTSGARFWMYGTTGVIQQTTNTNKAAIISGAGASFIANLVQITGQVQVTSNTANATFNLSTIASGSAACVDTPASPSTGVITLAFFGCTSTNTNTVTGSGVLFVTPGNVRLSTSGDIVATVTQAVVPGLPQGEVIIGAGATTGTNVLLSIRGGHIKAAQATAPTATVNANAGTLATCTLSNASDVAGKINLTTTATAPAAGTQCTITFNKAYGVAPHCVFSANNNNAVLFAVANGVFITTTTTTLIVGYANADALGHANNWMYHCLETQ